MIRHESMRGYFAYELYQAMKRDKNIILLVGDLGYKIFDSIRDEMPEQFYNCGAAEMAMMGMAVGMALEGKIPVVYSITTFLLYRPFETIRNYINHEQIPVKLVGSGRDGDYVHDGFSHWSDDASFLLEHYGQGNAKIFGNIKALWPETKEDILPLMDQLLYDTKPYFLSLKR